MAKDVRIVPADGTITFNNAAGTGSGQISLSGDDLVFSNAVGDVLFGDTDSDVYIGDGVNNVDVIFEQNGSIRGETGSTVALTLGSNETTLYLTGSTLALQKDGGNVGIGTTSPGDKLQVAGNAIVQDWAYIGDGIAHWGDGDTNITFGTDSMIFKAGNAEFIRLSEGLTDQLIINEAGAALDLRVEGDADTNLIRTDAANDRVGIGTGSPAFKLDTRISRASGAFLTDGQVYALGLQNTDTTAGNATAMTFGHGGYEYTNFIASVRTGTGVNPKGDLTFGGRPADGSNFVERMRIKADGNVGIGTTNPTAQLHVTGSKGAAWSTVIDNRANNGHGLYIKAGGTSGTRYITQWRDAAGTERFHMDDTGEAYFQNDITSDASILGNSLYTGQYIYHTGDTDTFIRFQTNDINLTAGGNNLFRVDGNSAQNTAVVNEAGIDLDFRVESDTVTHALFVEGSTGNVGIGTASPGATLTVNGIIEATEKSFNIAHPTKEGKRLIYGVLEGPEHGVYVRGKSTEKVIELPEVWTGLVHDDSLTVQLTCKGKPFSIWVEDIRDNKVYINTDVEEFEFFYYIQGERKDVDKLIIERDAD